MGNTVEKINGSEQEEAFYTYMLINPNQCHEDQKVESFSVWESNESETKIVNNQSKDASQHSIQLKSEKNKSIQKLPLQKKIRSSRTSKSHRKTKVQKQPPGRPSYLLVKRYCCQCKVLQEDHIGVTKQKFCEQCDSLLLYVCGKCNKHYFANYDNLKAHQLSCQGDGSQIFNNYLENAKLYRCSNCVYVTTSEPKMFLHLNKTNHLPLDCTGSGCSKNMNFKELPETVLDDPKLFTEKHCRADFFKCVVRYCPTCKKTIKSDAQRAMNCRECNDSLLRQCTKCQMNFETYKKMRYHVDNKCFIEAEYRCLVCEYTAKTWIAMHRHVKYLHVKLPMLSCALCPFKINRKGALEQHIICKHLKKLSK